MFVALGIVRSKIGDEQNIDIAPRVSELAVGDRVGFYSEYVWNEKGGTIHWTHRDPRGKHVAGWVLHNGKTYQ